MNAIDLGSVSIKSLAAGNNDAVDAVVSIWWKEIPSREAVFSQLGRADDFSLIAEYEGRLVGFILARSAYVGLPMVGVCLIHTIAVKPEYQQHGVGTLLVDKLKSDCKSKGIGTIRALVPTSNTRLASYCQELGFRPSTTINLDLTP